jgi:hypothetical protein
VLDLDSVVFDDNRDVEDLSVDFAVLRAVLVALVDVVRWYVREVAWEVDLRVVDNVLREQVPYLLPHTQPDGQPVDSLAGITQRISKKPSYMYQDSTSLRYYSSPGLGSTFFLWRSTPVRNTRRQAYTSTGRHCSTRHRAPSNNHRRMSGRSSGSTSCETGGNCMCCRDSIRNRGSIRLKHRRDNKMSGTKGGE